MSDPAPFISKAAIIDKGIENEVDNISSNAVYELPKKDSAIVRYYVQKIEGTYDVARSKKDTDNAIDLLYIAYNTTPQEEGSIRVKISSIMDKLIKSQQESELTMKNAMLVANNILGLLSNALPDWLDIKAGANSQELKDFASKDLLDLAGKIKGKAESVHKALKAISENYELIIKEIVAATSTSEKALGDRLDKKAIIEKEINEANADRERLEALVNDLQEEVYKFEKKAREYENKADTAEDRALIMSLVQVGAQMVSSAMPAIAMALGGVATGGTSIVAGSILNTAKQVLGGRDSGTKEAGVDQKAIQTKEDISVKAKEKNESDKKIRELKTSIRELESDKTKLQVAEDEGTKSGKGAESVSSVKLKELDGRIEKKKADLKSEEEKYNKLGAALDALQSSLTSLDKNLTKLTDQQQQQATSLRQMQMDMLEKVEAYEKEKSKQNSELIKITALLKGKRTEEETIQLAIKSLNLSISALKRTKEIIEEIAFFFKSFADFMEQVTQEVNLQMDLIKEAVGKETLRKNYLNGFIKLTDIFFIKQAGEWNAVWFVSERFVQNFADGWSKLNKLSGKYITGDERSAYLQAASDTLEAIVDEREKASKDKITNLDEYRKQILNNVAA
jgi:chromosome segregation ATPase